MALGGGTFTSMNKELPGSYINFVSAARATSNLSDRGIVALPFEFDWGPEGEVLTVTESDFKESSLYLLGYQYDDDKLKGLREMFKNINTCHFYRLNSGTKASNALAEAKYSGSRGNDLKVVIANSIDYEGKFEVSTMLDYKVVDTQIVSNATELKNNDFIVWKEIESLTPTAATPLAGGETSSSVTGESYQNCLDTLESYHFHALGCLSSATEIKGMFISFIQRMRDVIGAKCQVVVYKDDTADYEGVISVENNVMDKDALDASLVYWVTGIAAGCPVNQSNTNKTYDGEFDVNVNYNQLKLKEALKTGKFILHKVGDEVRVLEDINTFVSFTDFKNVDFSSNQVIRVLDQIAIDIARVFNDKYLGKINNNNSGRISFWNDLVTHHMELQKLEAIEEFKEDDIEVLAGQDKKSVIVKDAVTVVQAMAKLYMTVSVA
ncbi:MAG: phage tail sheath family protein [Paraclostridium sp.]